MIEPTHQLTFISSPAPKDWSLWGQENPKIQCNHGCIATALNSDHPAFKFVDTFIQDRSDGVSLIDNLQTLLTTKPKVWKDETLRNEALCILTSMVTNQLLHEQFFSTDSLTQAVYISKAIIALENHNLVRGDDIFTIFYHPTINAKVKNLSTNPKASGKRDLLKFISRRISCSCLKDMYRLAKRKMPKSRRCEYCDEVKERDQLMICGGCRLLGYCSTECQAADWKREHAHECTQLADYQTDNFEHCGYMLTVQSDI